ncbi:hypothetical protein SAY86_021865 [Trapa natans]|nr:hypothetical protein SAY86_021865 [Trapa natans]
MTTFYDDSSQRVSVPMFYLKEHLPSSYQEAHVLPGNMMLYMNPSSCSDTLGIDSISQQQQEILSDYSGSRVAEQDINTLRGFQPLGGSSCGMLQNGLEGNPDLSITNSVYLKATQKLLDEVVNIRKALKQRPEDARDRTGDAADGVKDEDGDSADKGSSAGKELSHSERQELQKKLAKLFGMLDEVDKRYTQYYHQMQIVAWGLDAVAGPGAAKPYTSLALQRISRHFRCLKDAINGQISATRKGLGEQDSSSDNKGVRIARLRYVDQQLRQQKALQQLGMMQQPDAAWRPQRGLPESSVSILRAWLFEHFLHP